ncbi:DNA-dependent ATPase fun30 [Recurvomyces mirabilis]|uniref:DNA helicase n=1 Tax=Recurvomyces mirabilis TaxID=574656 RepID=A0AAE0WQ13_9PEZI|nr:DNA-dependent ATPase fun30 [Recurvomyces mirabilis]KAK5155981.1 DNA-dependent ATPase fun30 [Recurvomyces mirabilis]
MADSDPISDSTPNKRRRLNGTAKPWDSENDSGDDLVGEEDYETLATMPLAAAKSKQLSYPASAFHTDMDSMTMRGTQQPQRTAHMTQPTQLLSSQQRSQHVTQPTQPLTQKRPSPPSSDVLVGRSSPPAAATVSPAPAGPAHPVFKRPRGSYLSQALAPAGTNFRQPLGVQSRPTPIALDDSDDDPPVLHSSDEETQGLSSNIRPTVFRNGGRGLDSTPNRSSAPSSDQTIRESPRPVASSGGPSTFASLMAGFTHDSSHQNQYRRPAADDLAASYGGVTRHVRPQQRQQMPARAVPVNAVRYRTLEDVEDYIVRKKIESIRLILTDESVQRCHDALAAKRGNVDDAMEWLATTEDPPPFSDVGGRRNDGPDDGPDELSTMSPVMRRGVAMSKSSQLQASQAPRPTAKQEVKIPSKTIAERYGATQRKPSRPTLADESEEEDEEEVRPKGRLLKGRKPNREPSPPSSPPAQKPPQPRQKIQQKQRAVITIDDDEDDDDSGVGRDVSEDVEEVAPVESAFETRLLKMFNDATARELSELSGQPEDITAFVIEQRPFASVDVVRTVSKAGPKSRSRPIGDKLVDDSWAMLAGYEAVDELVEECAKIAKPIQKALKGWSMNRDDGELELMNLDDAHDSGIGTPASSTSSDDLPARRGNFLKQPKTMDQVLRLKDYQLVGLNWLNLLWDKKISCILADDMGLGKTCQVISFLAHLQESEVDGVHLIIVPGSTIANWLREFGRFAPDLRVVPYYGTQAERAEQRVRIEDEFHEIDVVVTTYDVAVKVEDNQFLRKQIDPAVCVFDEAHLLRNPTTDRYQQLAKIKADFRLLLTGTPLQNNLQELVAILAFIMPGIFHEKRDRLNFIFDQKASTKDTSNTAMLAADRIARARTMMTPFILRRKKAQVLELPAKHSRVEWCDMTATQASFYNGLIVEAREALQSGRAAERAKKSSNIMMSLRKAAIQPLLSRRIYTDAKIDKIVSALVRHEEFSTNPPEKVRAYINGEAKTGQKLEGGDYGLHKFCAERPYLDRYTLKKREWMDSGKVKKFEELVTAYAKNSDRVLVFSQFTTLMDILEAVLETLGIKFMRLDGSTKMEVRQDMIDQFYEDKTITVFMLSTRAGGAGINLAAANKVIIFDSGFNPQDDIQAENRAHRVGQTREVEVVRLVTKGTIEEQIHALGESKLALDEKVAGDGTEEAEKVGRKMVEKMFLESLQKVEVDGKEEAKAKDEKKGGKGRDGDLKNMFKSGLESSGVMVASKQAQF